MDHAEPLCARCARQQQTCCQSREIYVSPLDEARIRDHTGRRDFTERLRPTDPDYLDQDDDPAWLRIFDRAGKRRVLKRKDGGDCTFLGERGCELPVETRPLTCRLYPFDYTQGGLRTELSHMCPTQLLKPAETLLGVLDMRAEQAEGWRGQLYREIAMEPEETR